MRIHSVGRPKWWFNLRNMSHGQSFQYSFLLEHNRTELMSRVKTWLDRNPCPTIFLYHRDVLDVNFISFFVKDFLLPDTITIFFHLYDYSDFSLVWVNQPLTPTVPLSMHKSGISWTVTRCISWINSNVGMIFTQTSTVKDQCFFYTYTFFFNV